MLGLRIGEGHFDAGLARSAGEGKRTDARLLGDAASMQPEMRRREPRHTRVSVGAPHVRDVLPRMRHSGCGAIKLPMQETFRSHGAQ